MHTKKTTLLPILFACLYLSFALYSCQTTEKTTEPLPRPNIIYIMSDDHANRAVSCYGSDLIQTPNIDRIAQEGILFNNSFVTNSICGPSRAVLLTGKYSHLNGLRDNRDRFDGSQLNFPKVLQQNGYSTAIVGKWHLKTHPTGFDYWNVLIGQGPYYNPRMVENGDTINYTGYTTEVITDLALDYLKTRDTSKPFCLLYHHKAPHRNWMPNPEFMDMYADEDIPLPATFYDDYATRSAAAREADMRIDDMFLTSDMKLEPGDYEKETGTGGGTSNPNFSSENTERNWVNNLKSLTPEQRAAWDAHYEKVRADFREKNPQGKELSEWKYQRYMKDYLRSIASVDANIGRVLDYLDENDLTENTIVIYTSDQGFYLGEHGWYDKRFMYEPSLKMPLVMRYPAAVTAGQKLDEMVLNLDFAPTLLDFAGAEIPAEMQGQSFKALSLGEQSNDWRKSIYYHYYEYPHGWHDVKRHYGVRTDRYKLIHFYNDIDAWELYDLQEDPDEVNNLYDQEGYEDLIAELKTELASLRTQYKVPEDHDLEQ